MPVSIIRVSCCPVRLSACPAVCCPPVAVTVSMLGRCHRAWPALLPRSSHDSCLHPFFHLVPVLFMASAARVKPFRTARCCLLLCCLSCSRQRSQLLLDTELGLDTVLPVRERGCQQAVTTGSTSELSLSYAPSTFSVAIRYSFLDLLMEF